MKEENLKIADAIAQQIQSGSVIDKNLTKSLIWNLCEEYKKEREGRIPPCSAYALEQDKQ